MSDGSHPFNVGSTDDLNLFNSETAKSIDATKTLLGLLTHPRILIFQWTDNDLSFVICGGFVFFGRGIVDPFCRGT